jgi:uncharacterized protein (DUF924 family)/alkyl hydroperoxide reductase subunit AhpC
VNAGGRDVTPDDVLAFWRAAGPSRWFEKDAGFDAEITARFLATYERAATGGLSAWEGTAEHALALLLVLDQFPRNMFRGQSRTYAADPLARDVARRAVARGFDREVSDADRRFFYLPFMHSEHLADQEQCVHLARGFGDDEFAQYAQQHAEIVRRFGRFPHRNRILGRASTAAEEAFLSDDAFRFDLPLKRGPDGAFVFAGAVRKRTVSVLGHEYETMLPAPEDGAGGEAAFRYEGPEAIFATSEAQLGKQGYMRIGDQVPDFAAETSMGPIRLHDFIGDAWCVLFSHPADFTPVCTTELGQTARLKSEWAARGVKVIGLSVDGAADHARWIADINETQGVEVDFPIIADHDRQVSMLFGMLDPTRFGHGNNVGQTQTVRSVFIISPAKRVELILTYPAGIGRNFDEILRAIDALQLSAKHKVATPANWRPGEDTVVLPFISDEEAETLFADIGGIRKFRSYLRFVRDPSLLRL